MKNLALLLLLGLTPLAHAQSDKGMYFGAGLGDFDYDERNDPEAIGIHDSNYAYQLFGGYKFNEHFALEGGIGGTGDLEGNIEGTGPFGPVTFEISQTYAIYTLTALGFLPFDRFSLLGGAGYSSASLDGEVDVAGFGTVGTISGHQRGATALLGIQRDFGLDLKSLSIRGQYQWYDFGDTDAAYLGLAVLFRF